MIRLTIHRALLDWKIGRAQRSRGDDIDGIEDDRKTQLVGTIYVVGQRVIVEVDARIARHLVKQCDEALDDPDLHDAKRTQIDLTRAQLAKTLERLENENAGTE